MGEELKEWLVLYFKSTPETINIEKLMFDNTFIGNVGINTVWGYLGVIALAMSLIYFLMEMNRKFALEGADLNFKSFFAPFLKLTIALIVLLNLGTLVGLLLDFNNAFVKGFNNAIAMSGFDDVSADSSKLEEVVSKWGFFQAICMLIPILLCTLIQKVLNIVWWYKAIMYKLEYAFRIMITPIACADIYSGQNSSSIRYLKKFIVMAIYGAALIALPAIASKIATAEIVDATNAWDVFVAMVQFGIIAPFAALSGANVAKQLASEALGS